MFEPLNFIYNLKYMGTGMLAIFVVIGLLVVITGALNDFLARKEAKKEAEESAE